MRLTIGTSAAALLSTAYGRGGLSFSAPLKAVLLGCTASAAEDADQAACTSAYQAYLVGRSESIANCPLGGGTVGEYRSNCPPGIQSIITDTYAACGGLVVDWQGVGGIDWDSEVGARMKYDVEKCGCSDGEATAPAFGALVILILSLNMSLSLI